MSLHIYIKYGVKMEYTQKINKRYAKMCTLATIFVLHLKHSKHNTWGIDLTELEFWNYSRKDKTEVQFCSVFHTVRNMCAESYTLFNHFVK